MSSARLRIGDWLVDAGANRLRHAVDGSERSLRHKPMALLLLLAEQPGETVSRELIETRIWDGNRFVAPKAINTAIWTIRQALGDDPEQPRYVETIAKKGYRLIASVERLPAPVVAEAAVATPSTETSPPRPPASGGRGGGTASWMVGWAIGLLIAGAALLIGWSWQRPRPAAPLPTPELLTQYPGVEFLGAVSPDGRQLAFAWWQGQGDADLYVRPLADRQQPPRAIGGARGDVNSLAWSADGRQLASIALAPDGSCTLWRIDVDRATQTALTRCQPLFTPSLAWSDDGQWLAFSGVEAERSGLFLIRPDGSDRRRLTSAAHPWLSDHQPAFSADGRRLAFVRADPGSGARELYEIRLPDGSPQRLTRLGLRSLHGITYAGDDIILSTTRQDSRQLLRWQRRDGQLQPLGLEGSAPQRGRRGELVYALLRSHVSVGRMALDRPAANPERLFSALGSRRLPVLDGHGERIAFVGRDGGRQQLWVQEGGQAPRELLQLAGDIGRPAWSADGRQLAFVGACGPDGQTALCRVNHDGSDLRPLLPLEAGSGAPTWLDSERLALVRGDGVGGARIWQVDAGSGRAQVWAAAPASLAGGRLAWMNGRLYLQTADDRSLLAWAPATDQRWRWPLDDHRGHRVVGWAAHPKGLVLLNRSPRDEWLERHALPEGVTPVTEIGRFALGSFPERASLSVSADGRQLAIELADASQGDLMKVDGLAASH